jgi:hypothetical protein
MSPTRVSNSQGYMYYISITSRRVAEAGDVKQVSLSLNKASYEPVLTIPGELGIGLLPLKLRM